VELPGSRVGGGNFVGFAPTYPPLKSGWFYGEKGVGKLGEVVCCVVTRFGGVRVLVLGDE